ncbi:MAG: hypothetical protein QOF76_879 [Solirubrobacteraceae bacterium]|jgi:O-antigen/teichoic acid export membrane protein|nr:hypothetical protein [Solirubrobacteraceae bacterium]
MEAAAAPLSLRERIEAFRRSDTAQAASLAVATIFQQLIAVVFTVIFTRILGRDGYGSLAALINLLVILVVPGAALQVAAARQGTLGKFGTGPELAATLDRWTRHILLGMVGLVLLSVLLRNQIATVVGVDEQWAAASAPVAAGVWLLISVQRGILQSVRAYKPVAYSYIGDGFGKLGFALILVAVNLDVTGAFVGQLISWCVIGIVLHRLLRARLGAPAGAIGHHLAPLARNAAVPIFGLTCVAALQNVDVIMARRSLTHKEAGVYAAATIAAKLVVWVAVGIGLWVLPEATRRAARGLDPRIVLARALGVIVAISTPAVLLFAAVPRLLLKLAFGPKYQSGDQVLLILGVAFALLAVSYITVQFLLGLHRRGFVILLGVSAVAEPLVLLGADSLKTIAWRVLAVQSVTAVVLVLLGTRVRADPLAGSEPVL